MIVLITPSITKFNEYTSRSVINSFVSDSVNSVPNENNMFSAADKKDPVTNRGFQIIHGCPYNNVTKSTRMYGHLANLR